MLTLHTEHFDGLANVDLTYSREMSVEIHTLFLMVTFLLFEKKTTGL